MIIYALLAPRWDCDVLDTNVAGAFGRVGCDHVDGSLIVCMEDRRAGLGKTKLVKDGVKVLGDFGGVDSSEEVGVGGADAGMAGSEENNKQGGDGRGPEHFDGGVIVRASGGSISVGVIVGTGSTYGWRFRVGRSWGRGHWPNRRFWRPY